MLVNRLMKARIECTMYDSFFEDEQVHVFRFYSASEQWARSERHGKVFSKGSFSEPDVTSAMPLPGREDNDTPHIKRKSSRSMRRNEGSSQHTHLTDRYHK